MQVTLDIDTACRLAALSFERLPAVCTGSLLGIQDRSGISITEYVPLSSFTGDLSKPLESAVLTTLEPVMADPEVVGRFLSITEPLLLKNASFLQSCSKSLAQLQEHCEGAVLLTLDPRYLQVRKLMFRAFRLDAAGAFSEVPVAVYTADDPRAIAPHLIQLNALYLPAAGLPSPPQALLVQRLTFVRRELDMLRARYARPDTPPDARAHIRKHVQELLTLIGPGC